MKKIILSILLILLAFPPLFAQSGFCNSNITDFAFKDGEQLTFKVYYNAGFLYVGAGKVTFTTHLVHFRNHEAWHVVAKGRTFSFYDWIFKVRDQYESYIDTSTLMPLKFVRNVHEGSYRKYNTVDFYHKKGIAISREGTYKIPKCSQDVISAIYYARNIDFSKYKRGDKIPFSLFVDDKVYHIYIRYMGKDKISTHYGTFNAILIKPLLIKEHLFKSDEGMKVWVSDDKNRIPLRISSPISVGSIKVDLTGFKNLRHPLTSLIKRN